MSVLCGLGWFVYRGTSIVYVQQLKVNYKESELVASHIARLFSSCARGKVLEEREMNPI
jgi:hypothetical protein